MMADTRVKKTMGTGMGVSKRRAADPRNGLDELQAQRLMLPGLAACGACAACYDAHDGAGAIKAQGLRAHPSAPSSPAPAAPPPAFAAAGSIQPTSRSVCTRLTSPAPVAAGKPLQGAACHCKAVRRVSTHSLPADPTPLPALRQHVSLLLHVLLAAGSKQASLAISRAHLTAAASPGARAPSTVGAMHAAAA